MSIFKRIFKIGEAEANALVDKLIQRVLFATFLIQRDYIRPFPTLR